MMTESEDYLQMSNIQTLKEPKVCAVTLLEIVNSKFYILYLNA